MTDISNHFPSKTAHQTKQLFGSKDAGTGKAGTGKAGKRGM